MSSPQATCARFPASATAGVSPCIGVRAGSVQMRKRKCLSLPAVPLSPQSQYPVAAQQQGEGRATAVVRK